MSPDGDLAQPLTPIRAVSISLIEVIQKFSSSSHCSSLINSYFFFFLKNSKRSFREGRPQRRLVFKYQP